MSIETSMRMKRMTKMKGRKGMMMRRLMKR